MSALNKKKFQQFLQQAKGTKVFEIHVNRLDRGKAVVLRYNGKSSGKRANRLTAEWSIARGEKDDAALDGEVAQFLAMARQHFFVHRGDGLEHDRFADTEMEAKGTPIISQKAD